MERHADRLDEALLSNAFAWIKKSSEDGWVARPSTAGSGLRLAVPWD
jgi:hypothetical protein